MPVGSADKPESERVAERFYRSWLAIERIEGGDSTKDPDRLNGQSFAKDSHHSWGRRGELSPGSPGVGPRIDTSVEPMRVDFINREKIGKNGEAIAQIYPCIFKFDGDRLVIADAARWVEEKDKPTGKDFPGRPTDFKSTKENGLRVEILKPCKYLDQD